MDIQVSFFGGVMDLLRVRRFTFIGLGTVCLLLYLVLKKDSKAPRGNILAASVLLYCYLSILFLDVVGIPSLSEFARVRGFGEKLFQPNLNGQLFVDGLDLGLFLNILCFLPLGFLLPLMTSRYHHLRYVFFMGFSVSLLIEVSQLFTLYRATDVNDLLANTLGTVLGYGCFRLLTAVGGFKKVIATPEKNGLGWLPTIIIVLAFLGVFLS